MTRDSSISIHQICVPVFSRGLERLTVFLDKALAHAQAHGQDPAELLQARLAPDMYPLTRQIQAASDAAKAGAARLAGLTPPSFPDTETTYDELHARIARTLEFVQGIAPAEFDTAAEREIVLKLGGGEVRLDGIRYLTGMALPNFLFHVTTAYDILRHSGVPLGKRDFLGAL